MTKIITLDKNLANQIAAGEVVERPVSVIKECVENSIDAWASRITIEIENWGIDLIKIIDNGEGIEAGDLPLVAEKYSTSKIKSLDDLYNVMTFGFRWEAIASIASVSNMSIISKTDSSVSWSKLEIIGWEPLDIVSAPCETGTTFIIEDLFYNTPARLNYLKKPKTEQTHILTFLQQISLAYPDIGIQFISEWKEIFHYRQNEDLLTRIYNIYGNGFSNNVLPVLSEVPWIKISWYISDPKVSFPNKNRQSLFVNKRVVKSPLIMKSISDAYNRFIPHGNHWAYVLFLDVDPTQVDVNVHPRKLEVRFANESSLFRSIYHTIQDKLDKVSLISDSQSVSNIEATPINNNQYIAEKQPEYYTGSGTKFKAYSPYSQRTPNPNQWQIHNAMNFSKEVLNNPENINLNNQALESSLDPRDTPLWRIIWQAHNSYIIVQKPDGIIFYDQHALAERIIYEKLLREDYWHNTQKLLIPEVVKLTAIEQDIIISNKEVFESMWFEIDVIPGDSLIIQAIPDFIKKENLSQTLISILSDIWEHNFSGSKTLQEVKNKIYAYTSCRAAIKFWHPLTIFEMNKLLHDAIDDYSATCPHGRPVVFDITLNELKDKYER